MLEAVLYTVGVVVFVLAMVVSIALHELGHLLTAKRFGARVSEFMVGFGPKIFSIRRGETDYGLRLIPLGGYVKIIGMLPPAKGETVDEAIARAKHVQHAREQAASADAENDSGVYRSLEDAGDGTAAAREHGSHTTTIRMAPGKKRLFHQIIDNQRLGEFALVEPSDKGRLFYELAPWKKIIVMAAGPVVNLLIAFVVFQSIFGIYGTHTEETTGNTRVTSVSECVIPERDARSVCADGDPVAPAFDAGLQPGDEIVSFNGTPVSTWDELTVLIRDNGAGIAQLEVLRDGTELVLDPTHTVAMERDISEDRSGEYATVGFLGAGPETHTVVERHGPIYTAQHMAELTGHAFSLIVQMPERVWNVALAIAGEVERDPDGPMSVVGGSRFAGEVAANQSLGLEVQDKAVMLGSLVGGLNLFLGIFNLLPLLPLDGGHIVGAAWEGLRRKVATLRGAHDPGFVDVARQLPVAFVMIVAFVVTSAVLIIGDLVVPLSSGL